MDALPTICLKHLASKMINWPATVLGWPLNGLPGHKSHHARPPDGAYNLETSCANGDNLIYLADV
jgi:hypothetical protein